MTPRRYFCPVCGRGLVLRVTPTRTPTCGHHNTPRSGRKPADMKLDTQEMMEGES